MKKILNFAFVIFLTFNAFAQKTPKWIAKKATNVSKDMQAVLSLTNEQSTKMYDEEVKKMLAIEKFKNDNGNKKPSNDEFKKIITPFVNTQTKIAGGKKRMNQYWAYKKEKSPK